MIQINSSLDQESVNLLVEGEIELCHFPESKVSNKKAVFPENIKSDDLVVTKSQVLKDIWNDFLVRIAAKTMFAKISLLE